MGTNTCNQLVFTLPNGQCSDLPTGVDLCPTIPILLLLLFTLHLLLIIRHIELVLNPGSIALVDNARDNLARGAPETVPQSGEGYGGDEGSGCATR